MFSGLVHSIGKILNVDKRSTNKKRGMILQIQTNFKRIKISESISVQGVCLTAIAKKKGKGGLIFTADISQETLEKTNLHSLKPGHIVNCEQSLRLNDRIGGHFIQGHVDATGKILKIIPQGQSQLYLFSYPPSLRGYLIPKGSIAVNGISLTLVNITEQKFSVSILPYTESHTTLGSSKIGESVNLEAELLAKIVSTQIQHILQNSPRDKKRLKNLNMGWNQILKGVGNS